MSGQRKTIVDVHVDQLRGQRLIHGAESAAPEDEELTFYAGRLPSFLPSLLSRGNDCAARGM